MATVARLLGPPVHMFSSDSSESWDYPNIAYDSASGRRVRQLTVWFKEQRVDDIVAVF